MSARNIGVVYRKELIDSLRDRRTVVSMIAVLVISLAMAAPAVVIWLQVLVLGAAALFILTRPLPPEE